MSALEGTFSGVLTADSIESVKNLTIAGRSVARTWAKYEASHRRGQEAVWRSVANLVCDIPDGESGVLFFTAQYDMSSYDFDSSQRNFNVQYNVLFDGNSVALSPVTWWPHFFGPDRRVYHAHSLNVGAGRHVIDVQWIWFAAATTPYPQFNDVYIKADFVKK